MTQQPRDRRDLRPWLRRLRNPETRAWLHLSGQGETPDLAHAWSGTRDQARTLRQRAEVKGEDWPYEMTEFVERETA